MDRVKRYSIAALCLLGLIMVRMFESKLFYDPFIEFFKNDYLFLDAPKFETFKLLLFTAFRYLLNTILSLGIIYTLFKDVQILKFSGGIYGFAFVLLLGLFWYLISDAKQEQYLMLFNVRRFLIQPILLLLLLPAFYYQRLRKTV